MSGSNNNNNNGNGGPPSKAPLYMVAGLLGAMLIFNMAANDGNDNIDPNAANDPSTATQANTQGANGGVIRYTEFKEFLNNGEVEAVRRQRQGEDQMIEITLENGTVVYTRDAGEADLIDEIEEAGATFEQMETPQPSVLASILPFLIFPAVFIGLMIWMQRRQMGGAAQFGKNKGKIKKEGDIKVRFDDVAGIEHVKEDLEEMVAFLKNPKKFSRHGAKMPTGALMVGPPGTGKTLMARAIAGEAGVPFISTSGSEFVEMFVGMGASRVRDLFAEAKKNAPCIIFIDEIDAVGRQRGAGHGGGNDEREQTLNQLLVEMDGFEENPGIIVLAATNRPDVLDPALKRPGRFDRQVVVAKPDLPGRNEIIKVHLKKLPNLGADVSSFKLAQGTPGFSGADLANLVNEAAILATRRDKDSVDMNDFEDAKDKIMMGAERPSIMSEKERKLTAYHEAGHAIVGYFEDHHDPLHKATIIPRGQALGMVVSLPERDRYSMTENEFKAKLSMAFGGRVAEELTFGKDNVTSGASSDIQQATNIARAMVTQYGFSDRLGFVQYEESGNDPFMGRTATQQKHTSEASLLLIEEEVKRINGEAAARAKDLLTTHADAFERLAQALLEFETLTGQEMTRIIENQPIGRTADQAPGTADTMPEPPEEDIANDNLNEPAPERPAGNAGGARGPNPWQPRRP